MPQRASHIEAHAVTDLAALVLLGPMQHRWLVRSRGWVLTVVVVTLIGALALIIRGGPDEVGGAPIPLPHFPTTTFTTSTRPPSLTGGGSIGPGGALLDQLRAANACDASLRTGLITYEPVRRMEVGRIEEVTAVATVDQTPADIPAVSLTTVVSLPVRCEVQARLRSPSFIIDPPSTEFQERSFIDESTVLWSWDVAPKEAGRLRLTLEVQSRAGNRSSAVRPFRADIEVDVTDRAIWQRVNDIASGFVRHPVVQFFGLAGVASAFGFFWRKFQDTAEQELPEKPSNRVASRTRRPRITRR